MLYKEFAPLKTDYETIVLSPTEIESVLNPSQYTLNDIKKRACTLWTWNIIEQIAWARVNEWREESYKLCKEWRDYINPNRMEFHSWKDNKEDKQFKWCYENLEQISDLLEPYEQKGIYNIRSHNSLLEIDYSWYKVLLKWEVDWWMYNELWCWLFDMKTAKQKRNELEKWEFWNYQSRFYSYMMFLAHPELTEITFEYLIVIKNKKPLLQTCKRTFTKDECEEFVKEKLKQYLTKLHAWEIQVDSNKTLNRW